MVEYLDLAPKVIKITWSDEALKTLFMKTNFGLVILEDRYKEGYVIAFSTEQQRENLRNAGFTVEIIFASMEDYLRSFDKT